MIMDRERFLLYSSVFVIMGLSNAVVPVLPELAASGRTGTMTPTSLLYSAFFLGALFTMLPFGILSDRFGKLKFVLLGVILSFIAGIVMSITDNFMMLVMARFLEGASCGAFFPAAFARLAMFKQKMRYIGEFNFLINGGLAAGVAVTGYLAGTNIKYGIYLFVLLTMLTLVFAFYHLLHSHVKGNEKRKTEIFPESGISPETGSTATIASTVPAERSYHSLIFSKSSLSVWITSFLFAGSSGVLISLYPDYSIDLLSKTELGIAIALLYISTMISSLAVSHFDLNYEELIKKGIVIAAFGVLVTTYYPIAGFTVMGCGSGILFLGLPLAITAMKVEHGMAMGIYNTCIYAGLALMPLIAGIFAGVLEIETIFIATGLLLGATVVLNRK
ncbi:MFS transporter [Methanococcoides sp. FTZ1]|uniref:MFS transporter n=1 Tax=Methanococcoides sp. FTZ1 TaxID=3439061 RepID=UPI003F82609B